MRIVDPIIAELEQEAKATRRVLERIPEDKLRWRPHPKSWSLGQLALHVAGIPGGVSMLASQDTVEVPGMEQKEARTRREVLETFEQGLATAKDTLGKMSDARASSTWTLTKSDQTLMAVPRIGLVRTIMLNHQYHHRGQLCVYLRLLNVPVPSVYGPSADENPFE